MITSAPDGRISYTMLAAAQACGVSLTTLREAYKSGRLEVHYPTGRPVVLVEDLRAWIKSCPTESPTGV